MSIIKRLEKYTILRPQEVLLVEIETEGEADEIIIFKGFSSSLMGKTPTDPDIPLIAEKAKIISISRLKSPYNPNNLEYLDRSLNWQQMEVILEQLNL